MTVPMLDKGFFLDYLEGTGALNRRPTLQIMESRQMASSSVYRLRLSDGDSSYTSCSLDLGLTDRFKGDGLHECNGIIRVTRFEPEEKGGKKWLKINDYEKVATNYPPLGNPLPYTGKTAADERGGQRDAAQVIHQQSQPFQHVQPPQQQPFQQQPQQQPFQQQQQPQYGEKRPMPASYQLDTYELSPKRGPVPARVNRPATQPTSYGQPVTPIDLLTPYVNKWRICGLVSSKNERRDVNTAKGSMNILSFIVTDSKGNAIKTTGFNEAADEFRDVVQNGEAYYISGTNGIRAARKEYNPTQHSYEISLAKNFTIEPCHDVTIPDHSRKMHVIPLSKITDRVGQIVDVLAVIRQIEEASEVTARRDQRVLHKRNIFLVDTSGAEVAYTLWGDEATNFPKENVGKPVAIKGAIVKEFGGGYSLSSSQAGGTQMFFDELPRDALRPLLEWHHRLQSSPEHTPPLRNLSSSASSESNFGSDLRMLQLAIRDRFGYQAERPVYLNAIGIVMNIRSENAVYTACPSETCRKKVNEQDGAYHCEKCNQNYNECLYRYMMSMEIADFTGSVWVTLFDDQAKQLTQMGAKELSQLKETDEPQYNGVFDAIRFRSFDFRLAIKWDSWNGEDRMKWTAMAVRPLPIERLMGVYQKFIDQEEGTDA